MKVEINEWNDESLEMIFTPETPAEVSLLLRYAMNASTNKPWVAFYFENNPYCKIFLSKWKESVQKNMFESSLGLKNKKR